MFTTKTAILTLTYVINWKSLKEVFDTHLRNSYSQENILSLKICYAPKINKK